MQLFMEHDFLGFAGLAPTSCRPISLGQGCPLCQELIVRLLEIADWAKDRDRSRHQRLIDALERVLSEQHR